MYLYSYRTPKISFLNLKLFLSIVSIDNFVLIGIIAILHDVAVEHSRKGAKQRYEGESVI